MQVRVKLDVGSGNEASNGASNGASNWAGDEAEDGNGMGIEMGLKMQLGTGVRLVIKRRVGASDRLEMGLGKEDGVELGMGGHGLGKKLGMGIRV